MKNELLIKTNEQAKTIDSRDVAEMMEKTHGDLLKDIQGSGKNLGIIPVLTKGNFPVVDYFIESSYVDGKGETRKCYLCTKLGCDMLGNKLRGEKGILFTASYVRRFNDMEKQIQRNVLSFQIDDPIERAKNKSILIIIRSWFNERISLQSRRYCGNKMWFC
jgi:Rha family phage regulatory protein